MTGLAVKYDYLSIEIVRIHTVSNVENKERGTDEFNNNEK